MKSPSRFLRLFAWFTLSAASALGGWIQVRKDQPPNIGILLLGSSQSQSNILSAAIPVGASLILFGCLLNLIRELNPSTNRRYFPILLYPILMTALLAAIAACGSVRRHTLGTLNGGQVSFHYWQNPSRLLQFCLSEIVVMAAGYGIPCLLLKQRLTGAGQRDSTLNTKILPESE